MSIFLRRVENHSINGVEVQKTWAYVLTDARTAASGTIQVVDIRDPANARVIGRSAPLPNRPQDIAVAGAFAYVPAGTAGLLVFDIRDPTAPMLLTTGLEGTFVTGITVADGFAYVVETRTEVNRTEVNRFTILDLQTPPPRSGAARPTPERAADRDAFPDRGRRSPCLPRTSSRLASRSLTSPIPMPLD